MAQSRAAYTRWYENNGEICRERSRRWYRSNTERAKAANKAYFLKNKEKAYAAHKKWKKNNPKNAMLSAAKHRAMRRGLPFDLGLRDIQAPRFCPVLGIRISFGGPKDSAPSLDRIDNKKGYIRGNVVVTSWRANRLKNDASIDELKMILEFYSKVTTNAEDFE